jgi:hypothetical protein
MIDLTKLLPPNVRRTQEWVDIIATYQQFLQSEIVPQMNSFLDRYEYDKISDEDALKTIWGFGFNISQGAGYTETHRYIQRQLRTMIKRIKSKGTEVSYQYLFYVYDLIGEVYPTIYTPFGFLRTYQNWLTSDELDLPPLPP